MRVTSYESKGTPPLPERGPSSQKRNVRFVEELWKGPRSSEADRLDLGSTIKSGFWWLTVMGCPELGSRLCQAQG